MRIIGIFVLVLYIGLFGMVIQVLQNKQKIKDLNEKYGNAMTTEVIGGNDSENKIIPTNKKIK